MVKVLVYTKEGCPYCVHAKQLLDHKKVQYTEVRVDLDPAMLDEVIKLTGRRTLPQIIINGESIGGFDDLSALEKSGQLDTYLSQ